MMSVQRKGLCLLSMTQHLLHVKNDMLFSQSNAALRANVANSNTASRIQEVACHFSLVHLQLFSERPLKTYICCRNLRKLKLIHRYDELLLQYAII